MSALLGLLNRRLVMRIKIFVLILSEELGKRHLVARGEEGYDQSGELRFRENKYTWKVGRENGMQDIYFVLEFTPKLEDQKSVVVLYHSLQRLDPEERYALQIEESLPILTKFLVYRYPQLSETVEDLTSLMN